MNALFCCLAVFLAVRVATKVRVFLGLLPQNF